MEYPASFAGCRPLLKTLSVNQDITKDLQSLFQGCTICGSRKYPYSPHRRDWKFRGGGGSRRAKNLKQCMKLNWNFRRGGWGGHRANPFLGGDMDTFWNHTMYIFVQRLLRLSQFGRKIRLNLLL